MAVTVTLSNHFKYMLLTGAIDMDSDVFKVILMTTGYSFNPDTHATLADVTSQQLSTGNGYTQDTTTLTKTASVVEDDANDQASVAWDDVQWSAVGGSLGPFGAAVIYDDTTADKTVLGCVDFGISYEPPDGGVFTLKTLSLVL